MDKLICNNKMYILKWHIELKKREDRSFERF